MFYKRVNFIFFKFTILIISIVHETLLLIVKFAPGAVCTANALERNSL